MPVLTPFHTAPTPNTNYSVNARGTVLTRTRCRIVLKSVFNDHYCLRYSAETSMNVLSGGTALDTTVNSAAWGSFAFQ